MWRDLLSALHTIGPTYHVTRRAEAAVASLVQLHIVAAQPEGIAVKQQQITLDSTFRASLRKALTGGDERATFGVQDRREDARALSIGELDDLARFKWEVRILESAPPTRLITDPSRSCTTWSARATRVRTSHRPPCSTSYSVPSS